MNYYDKWKSRFKGLSLEEYVEQREEINNEREEMNPDDIKQSWADLIRTMATSNSRGDSNYGGWGDVAKHLSEHIPQMRFAEEYMSQWEDSNNDYDDYDDDYLPVDDEVDERDEEEEEREPVSEWDTHDGWDEDDEWEEEEEPDHSWETGIPTPPQRNVWDTGIFNPTPRPRFEPPPRRAPPQPPMPRHQEPTKILFDDDAVDADDYLKRLGVK